MFEDSNYSWSYGSKNNGNIKSYKIDNNKVKKNEPAFAFRTAESFLNNMVNKSNQDIDLSKYKEGIAVRHKKFGEGVISKVEPEGEDLKVDIDFEKVGHKRLMAKFAKLEIL